MTRRIFLAVIMLAMLAGSSMSAAEKSGNTQWMVGFWHQVSDEDPGDYRDAFELRADGTYRAFDNQCNFMGSLRYHTFDGDVYVTSVIPGKGPIAVVFRPTKDRARLTFTSPRTRNNAVYERIAAGKCIPQVKAS